MSNEKLFTLIEELLERMEIAKQEAKCLKVNSNDLKLQFVHVGDKEYVNPQFLPFEHHCQYVQLFKFLKEHNEVKQEDLDKILSMCKTRFAVLIEVNKVVPNLVQEYRLHDDEKYISYLFFGLKQNKENNISI